MTRPLLHIEIGAQSTLARLEPAGGTPGHWCLPIGLANLWASREPGAAPSPLAIETAIQAVEDQIEVVQRHLPPGTGLALAFGGLNPLRRGGVAWAGDGEHVLLSRVEQEYQWLTARSEGAPSAKGGGFDASVGDALILILREFMHHLGVDALKMGNFSFEHDWVAVVTKKSRT